MLQSTSFVIYLRHHRFGLGALMDVAAIQRQLGQCTLEELIQIAIHLIFEIQYRVALQEQSESESSAFIESDSDDDL